MHNLFWKTLLCIALAYLLFIPTVEARDLGELLAQGPPPVKSCLQKALSWDQAEYLWHLLHNVNDQHERLFQLYGIVPPPQRVPAAAYAKVFPYKFSCSEIEKVLFYCLDQFQKDKDALTHSISPDFSTACVRVSAKNKPPKTQLTGPVKQVIFSMLILVDQIRLADCRLIYGRILKQDLNWPHLPLDKMNLSAAISLLIQKLEIIAQDNQHIIAKFESSMTQQ